MTSYKNDGTVGPWAKDKLLCLEKYLNAYTTILSKQNFRYYFVDAFAGSGRAKKRSYGSELPENNRMLLELDEPSLDQEEYIDGSPRVALRLRCPFQGYLFIEKSPSHAAKLEQLKEEFPKQNISVRVGDANEMLNQWVIENPKINWKNSRAVVFLDPFGTQVAWSTIEGLAKTGAIEVIINNPIQMCVQRLLEKSGNIPVDWRESLDTYFGCKDWEDVVYTEESDFFGARRTKAADASERLGRFYNERLRAAFGNAASVRLVRNTKGGPLYFLHWAGPKPTGLKIADHILAQGETI